MRARDAEFQRLVGPYIKNYRRLMRLISIQKNRPGHMDPQKLERRIASKQRQLRELEAQTRKTLEEMETK